MSKSKVSNENYYVVQGWMRNVLGLKGNALDIYAIIYGFSQVSHQEFTASINYLCEWIGASRPTVINTLKDLVDNGYLTKESNEVNGVIYNRYTAIVPDLTGGKEILLPQLKNFTTPSKKILPNNINNKLENNIDKSLSKDKEGKALKKKSYNDIFSTKENEVIKDALVKFVSSCKGKNYNPKIDTVEKWASFLREHSKNNSKLAMAIVDQSIEKSWKSLYPLKNSFLSEVTSEKWDGNSAKDENGNDIVF